jgi:Pvc16 N-terminal domain
MSSAIRDAGQTLIDLLRLNLVPAVVPNNDQIGLLSPTDVNNPGGTLISLFLYSVMPAAEFRNENEAPRLRGNTIPQAMPVELYYLLTTYSQQNPDLTERTLESHLLLGQAMRVFFDNAILTGSALRGALPRDSELRLTYQPITVEDMTRIWSVFPQSSLRTSVSYVLSPVSLLSIKIPGVQPVTSRHTDLDQMVPTPQGGAD